MRLAWVVVALAACGDDEVGAPTKSGTRLALEWYQTDDGSRLFDGNIYDHVREQSCFLESWADGTTRCLDSNQGFIAFSDAACTQAVVLADGPGIAVHYDKCVVAGVFAVGAPISATQYYVNTPTGCGGPYSGSSLYALGASIDRSTFASVDKTALLGGGRLQQIDYTSSDGLRMLDEVHDTELATTCYQQGAVCAPTATYNESFSDASCTQRVTSLGPDPCGPPPRYYAEPDPACPDVYHYYALGPVITVSKLYALDSSRQCMPQMIDATQEYHAVGAEVAPASLSNAITTAPGHRLQTIYAAGSGIALPSGTMFDAQLGIACGFTMASDGKQRCLPFDATYGTWWGDASCTREIRIAIVSACSSGPAPLLARGSTGSGDDVRVVVGPYSGRIYSGSSQSCGEYQPTGSVLYEVGDLADGAQFASAAIVTDP